MRNDSTLIFEKSLKGRRCVTLPKLGLTVDIPENLRRAAPPELPEIAEVDLVRHYTNLSGKAHGVDNGFYPLGSCTMKYNPKRNEDIAALPGFTKIHPLQSEDTAQGCLAVLHDLAHCLCDLSGMDDITLQPAAGAHGEFSGLLMVKEYFRKKNDVKRTKIIVPDSAHGTNPAGAAMCGFEVVAVPSDAEGFVDIEVLRGMAGEDTAALMLTNPNTVGLFEKNIGEIAEIIHGAGGLLYYDGANLNAIMGRCRPGDMGFDIVHINLHKTFSTPHGGGGPGSGPVGCKAELAEFLPGDRVILTDGHYSFEKRADSIGKVKNFYGNFLVCLKAYAYILTMGGDGLREVSENAVLNANYLLHLLAPEFTSPFGRLCMHEFVLSLEELKKQTSVSAADVAKKLIDNGIHPPTMYFPLIVPEALMVEPTETESKETLERAAAVLKEICALAFSNPAALHDAPVEAPIRRADELTAARNPILKYSNQN